MLRTFRCSDADHRHCAPTALQDDPGVAWRSQEPRTGRASLHLERLPASAIRDFCDRHHRAGRGVASKSKHRRRNGPPNLTLGALLMNTTTNISDETRPLTGQELDGVSGGMITARFKLGTSTFIIVASEYDSMVIRQDCCCR